MRYGTKWAALALLAATFSALPARADDVELKIAIISWNTDETLQDEAAIAKLVKEAKLKDADLIVVGEQETNTKTPKYLAQRLAESVGGFYADPEGKGKNCKTDMGKSRQTIKAGSRTLTVGAAWSQKLMDTIGADQIGFDREVVKGKRKFFGLIYTGKGGTILYMDLGNRRLAFVSCHLNDESSKKRDEECAEIVAALEKNDPDAVFLMGDLNYRPIYAGEMPDLDSVLDQLVDKAKRAKFYKANDVFGTGKAALVSKHKFTFPDPDFLPTYHRNAEGLSLPPNPDKEALKTYFQFPTVYANKDDEKKKANGKLVPGETKEKRKEQKEYAIGWLDRIGYNLGDGDVKISDVEFISGPSIGKSDHAPVMLMAKIKFDPKVEEK